MIKEKLPTLRSAVEAMLTGLRDPAKYGLKINMGTYGEKRDDVCYGCAATATMFASGLATEIRDCYDNEFMGFESRIDSFRNGYPQRLQAYYGLAEPPVWYEDCGLRDYDLPYLGNEYTEEDLALVEAWLDKHYPEEK